MRLPHIRLDCTVYLCQLSACVVGHRLSACPKCSVCSGCTTKNKSVWTCADFVKYYNSYKCILGDIGIDKNKVHSKKQEVNCADANVVIGNTQMKMICGIPVLFGKWKSHSNFIYTSQVTTNNPFLSH